MLRNQNRVRISKIIVNNTFVNDAVRSPLELGDLLLERSRLGAGEYREQYVKNGEIIEL